MDYRRNKTVNIRRLPFWQALFLFSLLFSSNLST